MKKEKGTISDRKTWQAPRDQYEPPELVRYKNKNKNKKQDQFSKLCPTGRGMLAKKTKGKKKQYQIKKKRQKKKKKQLIR